MNAKICILTTVSASIKAFYKGQLEALKQAGFDITVICADDGELNNQLPENVKFYPVPFSRMISPLSDIKAILKLIHLFRKERFDIVQYSTPKASLLSAIAAFLAKVPIRVYILWGLYYTGQTGFKYKLFKFFEKNICSISTNIIPISHEMVEFALGESLGTKEKYEVMLNGSACGVDLGLFNPEKWKPFRNQIRDQYHIPENATVIGTVARLTGDKGINELVQAFDVLSNEIPRIYLLLIGEEEEKNKLDSDTVSIIKRNNRIRCAGWQDNPLPYYSAMDIFCLPTYREGFGEVNLEAQAMELPVISTNTIGPRESVEDGITGFLVKSQSSKAQLEPLRKLICQPELRIKMGKAGRQRVVNKFDRKEMIKAIVEHRKKLLETR
ncbi:MAG: glycosyltransferase family 4 protein [Planctomycetes bacterium]|nr:glycosyltransferase family 4 protein [Planctomycetota bacterium]MBU1518342.1 glycosyltransferase family 4 protein [Planctomycetota bacterium]MBU2458565.1 glycosyltransferase family 4 protein [Planctomycetota bacterium]MBU2596035.1 glycosyltransferase family 4 protein [Planctomycetota bacterium]